MTRDEVRRLIGGYATGTLTEAERSVLMQAALEDQEIFDELAQEEELKELLDAPGVRGRLIDALQPVAQPAVAWWQRPWAWAGAAACAALALTVLLRTTPEPPVQIADARPAEGQLASQSQPVKETAVPQPVPKDEAPREAESAKKTVEQDRLAANAPASSLSRAAAPEPAAAADAERKLAAPAIPASGRSEERFADASSNAAQTAASEDRRRDQGGVIGGVAAEQQRPQAPAAAAVPVPPPPPARPAVLAKARAKTENRVAFRYSVIGNSLQITPLVPGVLQVVTSAGVRQNMAPASRNAGPGAPAQFTIPAGSTSVVVSFSSGEGQKEEASRRQNVLQNAQQKVQQVQQSRSGEVAFESGEDTAAVEISLQ